MESLIRTTTNERSLTDEQFREIAAFADAPQPVPVKIDREEFARLMAVASATLKLRPSPDGEGEIKLGVYYRVLGELPAHNLRRAFHQALRECDWFPTPAALLKMAEGYTAQEITLHQRARYLAGERRHREQKEQIEELKRGELCLADASDRLIQIGIAQGYVFRKRDGSPAYRTAANLAADAEAADPQADRNPEGEDRNGLRAEHESGGRVSDAPKPANPLISNHDPRMAEEERAVG